MKKILFILHYPPPIHGAAIVGKFVKESDIINNNFDCNYINLGISVDVDEIGKGGIKKWFRYISIFRRTIKNLVTFKPDLVYFTITSSGFGFYKDFLVVLIAKIFGKQVVYHFHNKGVKEHHHKFIDNILYDLVFKNADVILVSSHLYEDVAKYVPKEKVWYCPNGIPEKNIAIDDYKKVTTEEEIEILFLSNLFLAKGVYILLDACKILKDKGLSFRCNIIGGEGDISPMELEARIVEMDLENCVIYKGKKYGKDKEQAFSNADMFVFPTYNETFGLVNLEAMQFSLPIIATYEGGIPEIIEDGETGFMVPKRNVEALAEKMEILIKNSHLREEMGTRGRIAYEEKFTLEKFEERLCEILKKIVE